MTKKEETMNNNGRVYFGLKGDEFDPEELTSFLGINPSAAKMKGHPVPKRSYWTLSTETVEDEYVDIYQMSSLLIKKLRPYTKKIIEAKQKFKLEAVLQVVLWITTDDTKSTPVIGFETDVIAFLHEVKASIDIDTYRNY